MAVTRSLEGAGEGRDGVSQRKLRRRDNEVLEAATRVFYQSGYAAATVQDVADALGMLKGSLYYYIRSKEELLYRLAVGVHDDVDVLLAEIIGQTDLSALARVQEFVRRQVAYNVRHLEAISVYYHDVDHLSPEPRKEIIARRRRHEAVVCGLVAEAQRDGDVDPARNAYVLGQCVFATVIWIYRWYRPSARIDIDVLSETCAQFVTSGISAVK